MLSVNEVAKIFGVSRQTILNWINKGLLKASQPDRLYFISQEEVDRLKGGDNIAKQDNQGINLHE